MVPRFICAVAIAVACGAALPSARQQQTSARTLTPQRWTIEGVERTGLVAAPPAKSAEAGAPLVFVFHGHGGTSRNISRTLGLHTEWPEAAVIYLQGLPAPSKIASIDPQGKLPGWQNAPGALGDRDLKLVDAVLAWAGQQYKIDPKRIYAAGHSNGALFSYLLWAKRGETFAAFAPASAVFTDMILSAKPKPALLIAGEQDALVPFAAQQRNITAVLRLNRADAPSTRWSENAVRYTSNTGAETVVYVHHGGHPLPPDAATLVAKFFKTHQ